jgi:hypothetical protein
MSVAALAAELRRAVATFPITLLDQAAALLTEAQAGYAEAARGTTGHELPDAVRLPVKHSP